MPIDLILPVGMSLAILTYGLFTLWYVLPLSQRWPRSALLVPLLLPHGTRALGLSFLIPGVTTHALDTRFAFPAAYGDLLAAVLALLAVVAVRQEWRLAIPLVWVFNIEGSVDFMTALAQGLRFAPPGDMGATYFIPMAIIPALIVSHAAIYALLLKPASSFATARP